MLLYISDFLRDHVCEVVVGVVVLWQLVWSDVGVVALLEPSSPSRNDIVIAALKRSKVVEQFSRCGSLGFVYRRRVEDIEILSEETLNLVEAGGELLDFKLDLLHLGVLDESLFVDFDGRDDCQTDN